MIFVEIHLAQTRSSILILLVFDYCAFVSRREVIFFTETRYSSVDVCPSRLSLSYSVALIICEIFKRMLAPLHRVSVHGSERKQDSQSACKARGTWSWPCFKKALGSIIRGTLESLACRFAMRPNRTQITTERGFPIPSLI